MDHKIIMNNHLAQHRTLEIKSWLQLLEVVMIVKEIINGVMRVEEEKLQVMNKRKSYKKINTK